MPPKRRRQPQRVSGSPSTVERVVAFIKDGIRGGTFGPGHHLVEADLQSRLGVSRGPIREAIRRLAADGLLHSELHRGARVRDLTPDEIEAVYQVREALEALACRLAAENPHFPDRQLLELERQFDKSFDGSAQAYLAYNHKFHQMIVRTCRNAELIRLVDNLQIPSFLLLVGAYVEPISIKRARAEHRPIVKAILTRDGAKAERAMRSHIRNTKRFVMGLAAKGRYRG